ncbi:hypothetical protein F5Y12DRAFT_736704 [Xylaria sp. FL1777]|nr:hypothetical protein F5Y12DRAFT_736704 [Xylaria sp. FL1777]
MTPWRCMAETCLILRVSASSRGSEGVVKEKAGVLSRSIDVIPPVLSVISSWDVSSNPFLSLGSGGQRQRERFGPWLDIGTFSERGVLRWTTCRPRVRQGSKERLYMYVPVVRLGVCVCVLPISTGLEERKKRGSECPQDDHSCFLCAHACCFGANPSLGAAHCII